MVQWLGLHASIAGGVDSSSGQGTKIWHAVQCGPPKIFFSYNTFFLLQSEPMLWEEKGTTEDEMVGWHHRLDGHEFE